MVVGRVDRLALFTACWREKSLTGRAPAYAAARHATADPARSSKVMEYSVLENFSYDSN